MVGLIIALMAFATGRIIRFLVDDTLIDRQRAWVHSHIKNDKLYELATCPWCLSGWIAAAVVLLTWVWNPLPLPFLTWLAVWWGGLFAYWLTEFLAKYAELGKD